jgi:uncharacterized integral membrane protein
MVENHRFETTVSIENKERPMIRNILFVLLIGAVLVFVVQNTQVVEVRFLFWTLSMSRALILLITLAIGLVSGWLLTFPKRRLEKRPRKAGA